MISQHREEKINGNVGKKNEVFCKSSNETMRRHIGRRCGRGGGFNFQLSTDEMDTLTKIDGKLRGQSDFCYNPFLILFNFLDHSFKIFCL